MTFEVSPKMAPPVNPATLDDAMLETGFGVYNIVHMLLSGVILMGVIIQNLILGYVLPAAQCELDLSLSQRGWLAALPFLGIILTSYVWGWVADTRGRRFTMLLSTTMSTLFSIVLSLMPDITSFAVFTFLSAIFMSGSSAVVYTYIGEFTNVNHRDKMVAFGASFVGIGSVVLPGIAWLILPLEFSVPISFLGIAFRSWRLLILTCTIPFIVGAIFLLLSSESPKFLYTLGKNEECLKVLSKIYAINTMKPKSTYPVKSLITEEGNTDRSQTKGVAAVLSSMKEQTFPLFKMPLLPWTCLACFIQFGILATNNGFYVWFPTILNSLAGHVGNETRICDVLVSKPSATNVTQVHCDDTINTSTYEMSIYVGLVFCSMYIIVGFLVSFVSKKLILVVVLVVTGLCGIGAHLVYNQQVAIGLFALFQMCGACIGLMNAVSVELFPTKYRAMAVCLSMMMGRVGSMVGSNLIGIFLGTNCSASFYLFGGILIVCGLACFTLPGKKDDGQVKSKEMSESEATEVA
ncbi:synaptic vesicle glycoprotein 2C-like [Aricia agestis]|uniref:synaptic vesicle glycoprotein 2C-like n=1 Tax=Aricia agestis TaxID=91739 RepID=UPI001C203E81|nr:synaptic vesicle glycoprotein 2C-like [Aricia agestis]